MIISIIFNPITNINTNLINQIKENFNVKDNHEYNTKLDYISSHLNNYISLTPLNMEYIKSNLKEDTYDLLITIDDDNEIKLFAFLKCYHNDTLSIEEICKENKLQDDDNYYETQLLNTCKDIIHLLHFQYITIHSGKKYIEFYKKNQFIIDNNNMIYEDNYEKEIKPLYLQDNELQIILAFNPRHTEQNKDIIKTLKNKEELHNIKIEKEEENYNIIKNHIITDTTNDDLCIMFKEDIMISLKDDKSNIDGIIVVMNTQNKTYGYAIFHFDIDEENEKELYIDFLCSNKSIVKLQGIGSTIINVSKYIIRFIKYNKINLGAHPSAIEFYEKQGFIFKYPSLYMFYKEPTIQGGKKKRKTIKKRKSKRKINKMKTKKR